MATPAPKRTTAPAFQFYAKDFLSSSRVQRMTLTEVGIYIILLSHNWLSGGIPVEPSEIAKIVKMPASRFGKVWAGPLSECFVKRGGRLVNERLEDERRKQIAYRDKQAQNGKKGGRRLTQAFPTANPTLSPREASLSPSMRVMEIGDSNRSSRKEKDVLFAEFRDAYPSERRKGGFMVEQAFVGAVDAVGFDALMAALRNHLGSEQWSNPRMIPGMDVWFSEERWRQELQPKAAKSAKADPFSPEASADRLARWKAIEQQSRGAGR